MPLRALLDVVGVPAVIVVVVLEAVSCRLNFATCCVNVSRFFVSSVMSTSSMSLLNAASALTRSLSGNICRVSALACKSKKGGGGGSVRDSVVRSFYPTEIYIKALTISKWRG